jgi:hypothetical protein
VSSLRLWIGLFGLVCFLAGSASGILFGRTLEVREPVPGPFAEYQRLLVERFELAPERERLLRELLEAYQRDIDRVRERHTTKLLAQMEPELRPIGTTYRALIRDELIPAERRPEFDRFCAENAVNL